MSCDSVHVTFFSKPGCPLHCMSKSLCVCVCLNVCVWCADISELKPESVTFVCLLLKLQIQALRKGSDFFFLLHMIYLSIVSKSPKAPNTQENNPFWKVVIHSNSLKKKKKHPKNLVSYNWKYITFLTMPDTVVTAFHVSFYLILTTLGGRCQCRHVAEEGQVKTARHFCSKSGSQLMVELGLEP